MENRKEFNVFNNNSNFYKDKNIFFNNREPEVKQSLTDDNNLNNEMLTNNISYRETADSEGSNNNFLLDDEEFLPGDDSIIFEDKNTALIQQLENTVSIKINGLYTNRGNIKNKYVLKTDPPILEINSSEGDGASFVVTPEVARNFERFFGDIHRAYFGLKPKENVKFFSKKNFKQKFESFKNWAKEHKIKAAFAGIIIIGFISITIIGLIF